MSSNSRTITDKTLIQFLWGMVAFGVPIFGVSFGHLKVGFFHFAPSFVFMLGVLYVSLLSILIRRKVPLKNYLPKSYRILGYVLFAFVIFHLFSLLYSSLIQSDFVLLGIKSVVKIFTGYFIFWMTILFFPRDKDFIRRFFLIAASSLSILLAYFIYKYAVVFNVAFMGADLDESSKGGKNQLAVQAAFFFPFVLSCFLDENEKRRWLISIPLAIIVGSLLYLQSRMGWGAACFSMLYIMWYTWRCNQKYALKHATKIAIAILAMGVMGFFVISHFIDLSELMIRVLSIFDPSAIPEDKAGLGKNSYLMRGGIILDALKAFTSSPIFGVGVANTYAYIERLTHNDLATIIMEFGLVGIVLFIFMLTLIWRRGQRPIHVKEENVQWLSLASRGSFVALMVCMNFFNIYLSPYFWFYLAMYVVTVETVDPIQNLQSSSTQ